jgi:hypothetical protein
MKLVNQVCTLEQGKKLASLGVEDSHYKWVKFEWEEREDYSLMDMWTIDSENHPAFTVAELGEMLPAMEYTYKDTDSSDYGNWQWQNDDEKLAMGMFDYEAHAKADRLIGLLERKKITPEEVNERLKD